MAATTTPQAQVADLLAKLNTCDTSQECMLIARDLGGLVKTNLLLLESAGIVAVLVASATNKKSGLEREGGLLGIAGIARTVGRAAEPYMLPLLPMVLDAAADKGAPVREAAAMAADCILALLEPVSLPLVLPILFDAMTRKWQTKVAAIEQLVAFCDRAPVQTGAALPAIIPAVTECMHETKAEVSRAAIAGMVKLCGVVGNPDIEPHIQLLVDCMAHPDHVAAAVQKLSATTFVAEVTGPALAIMVPLLFRALADRSAAVLRSTVVIANNLFKLVRVPREAGQFMPQLLPGLERIIETAAFPEIRALATAARNTLVKAAGGEKRRDSAAAASAAVTPAAVGLQIRAFTSDLGLFLPSLCDASIEHVAFIASELVRTESYDEANWVSLLSPYLTSFIFPSDLNKLLTRLFKHYNDAYIASQRAEEEQDDDEGEELCNCEFSLAYGGMMLLNNTRLRLKRGQRYGLCGHNGAGKSTLMRAISLGKLEGFPSQDDLRSVFVEHSLQGEEADLSVLDFIASDKRLANVKRTEIAKVLHSVGFNDERQEQPVGTLSGGWKMKLELARAMLMKADILLLDEPTNHLDVQNVAWLENYLVSQTQITCIIVSHDSTFLDNVCTQIIHYENKKLVYYKGNLSKFVEKYPAGKSYYTLSASTVKFSFPPPSILLGIRSNTKAIMKMTDGTFTYPGAPKPSLMNASVQLSLSSRVGIIGPNGAGKSTLIKVLTGEAVPQQGTVWKHPNLRVGYVAQHAFHHLEQHLELTPNQYIQWRYQGGQDREILEKATRKLTDEDARQMEVLIPYNGEKRRIEYLLGRQKLKKSFQYEIKWVGFAHKHNAWLPREKLLELGFNKLVQAFDDQEASREGQGYRELVPSVIRSHIEEVGLDGDIADNNPISGLSGGQKVKVVLAAAMWNNPHMLVLDEPTNYLDRDSLGGLAVAIRDWGGAVVMISHNKEFVEALCPEIWSVEAGIVTHRGKSAVVDDHFEDSAEKIAKSLSKSAGRKKMTRNDLKMRELRRRARHLKWLQEGGTKEPDTESD
ncbi:P-loop containing nucleoside triphosphate hydrolase protein [Entophlyctis helioformis]|nr:P-loop containing nucleoside triphosphate hydrolase protein [Entophlyctis helioformis]KAI8928955.1 P-loop containing nucleoside triphosphate hydrolase protein [Entophlyctis helioformis]